MIRTRPWIAVFAVFATLMITWAVATPLFASPDEPAHVIKAAGVVRGQFDGSEPPDDAPFGARTMEVPAVLEDSHTVRCVAFQPDWTADCISYDDRSGTVRVETTAGRHPPFYYAIVGLPTLVDAASTGIYAMRVLSALGTAALLAAAWVCLGSARSGRAARVGLAVVVTPMVLFLGGMVNPSGWEIAAAVLLWSSGLALCSGVIRPKLVHAAGVAAIVLVLTRQLGPVWLVLVVAALAVVAAPGTFATVRSRGDVRAWSIGIVAAIVAQIAWTLVARPLSTSEAGDGTYAGWSLDDIARESFGRSRIYFDEIIGVFGWRDTAAPAWTYLVWTAAILGLAVVGIIVARRRELVVLGVIAVLTIAIPIVSEMREFHEVGHFWQGRYTLPLAVGIPLLSAWALARRTTVGFRVALVLGLALGSAQFVAFTQALRRYSVGARSEALAFWADPAWTPPIPILVLLLVYAAGIATWYTVGLGPETDRPIEPVPEPDRPGPASAGVAE